MQVSSRDTSDWWRQEDIRMGLITKVRVLLSFLWNGPAGTGRRLWQPRGGW